MNINAFNLLIASGIIYGIVFSISIFLSRKKRIQSSINLACVVLFLSISNLYYWIDDSGFISDNSNYILFHIPWGMLVLPFYYLFVQNYFQKKILFKKVLFIPFTILISIHVVMLAIYALKSIETEILIRFANNFYVVEELLAAIFTLYVIIKTYQLIKTTEKIQSQKNSSITIETNWLKSLLFFGLLICFFWISSTIYYSFYPNSQYVIVFRYSVWISISTLIYWLGYLGNYYGVLFKQRSHIKERLKTDNTKSKIKKKSKIDYVKSVIEDKKLFLDPSLSISKVAEYLELTEKYFSKLFVEHSEENYSNYIKRLRVNEAKKILNDPNYKNYTILAIGLESGFNSKSAFYRVFKEVTGITPTEFRKRNKSRFS